MLHLKANPSIVSIWVPAGSLGDYQMSFSLLTNQLSILCSLPRNSQERMAETESLHTQLPLHSPHPLPPPPHILIPPPYPDKLSACLLVKKQPVCCLNVRGHEAIFYPGPSQRKRESESRSKQQAQTCFCRHAPLRSGAGPRDQLTLPYYGAHQVVHLLQRSGCFQGAQKLYTLAGREKLNG